MLPPDDFDPPIGVAEVLEPGLRRIVAPNPSPMTYRGTNTYLLGTAGLAVIDPGPESDAHLGAILAAVAPGQKITHIVVTHAHLDHSPLSRRLSAETGAPVHAFGPASAGRSAAMASCAEAPPPKAAPPAPEPVSPPVPTVIHLPNPRRPPIVLRREEGPGLERVPLTILTTPEQLIGRNAGSVSW